jgi:phosphonate transport system substrate-binding protein
VSTGRSILAALLLCGLSTGARAQGQKCETPPSIRFSTIPAGDLETDLRRYQPLFRRIEELTGKPVSVVRPSSYASVVEGLMSGSIDIARLGPATYVEAREGDERITAFATTERLKGEFQVKGPYYNALLVVLASSRHRDIDSLKGARLALTDPASTSGSRLPRQQFAPRLGVPLEKFFATLSFSGSHAKSVLALARGDVDAAFIASTQLEEAHVAGILPAGQVRVLWTSDPIPHDPFVYRGQLCEPLRRQIRAAFLDDQATRSLRALLDGFNAARFVAVDDSNYAGIRRLLARPAP